MVEEIKTIEERKNKLIALGKKQGFITYEQLADELKGLELDKQIMTYSTFSSGGRTYSLQKYGNMEIKFEKFWQQRCID